MIDSNNAPGTALKFAFGIEPALGIHIVAIVRAVRIEVATLSKSMDNPLPARGSPDQESAAFMRIGRFHMIVNLSQHRRRDLDHAFLSEARY
jgi:hypothetical protein